MPFLVLVFNLLATRKLAERGLTPDDVRDVFQVAPVVTIPNPNPRTDSSRLAIGPTREGRFITAVVEQDAADPGRWHVRTAWDATTAQVRLYRTTL